MQWNAWSVVFTGLSLTSVTAVVLFVLVAINPKDAAYGSTPLAYAAGSALFALAFNRASVWAARRAGGDSTSSGPKQSSLPLVIGVVVLALGSPGVVRAQSTAWDPMLSDSFWHGPEANPPAYVTSGTGFNDPTCDGNGVGPVGLAPDHRV